jgi:hypothetical protein
VLGDYLPELPPEMDDPAIQDALFRYACELGEISNFQHQADEDHEKELDAQFDDDDPPEID